MTREEREEAIKILNEERDFQNTLVDKSVFNAINTALEALKADPCEGWVPANERLPKKDGVYIISVHCAFWDKDAVVPAKWRTEIVRGKQVRRWYHQSTLVPKDWQITAWRALPEPYVAKEK